MNDPNVTLISQGVAAVAELLIVEPESPAAAQAEAKWDAFAGDLAQAAEDKGEGTEPDVPLAQLCARFRLSLEFRTFRLLRRAQNGRRGVIAPIFGSTYHQYAFTENRPNSLQRLAPDASSLRRKARNSSLAPLSSSAWCWRWRCTSSPRWRRSWPRAAATCSRAR